MLVLDLVVNSRLKYTQCEIYSMTFLWNPWNVLIRMRRRRKMTLSVYLGRDNQITSYLHQITQHQVASYEFYLLSQTNYVTTVRIVVS